MADGSATRRDVLEFSAQWESLGQSVKAFFTPLGSSYEVRITTDAGSISLSVADIETLHEQALRYGAAVDAMKRKA